MSYSGGTVDQSYIVGFSSLKMGIAMFVIQNVVFSFVNALDHFVLLQTFDLILVYEHLLDAIHYFHRMLSTAAVHLNVALR